MSSRLRIAFVISDASVIGGIGGGANVLIEHAAGLAACGHDVFFLTSAPGKPPESGWHPRLRGLRVSSVADAEGERFDVAFATWWLTFFDLSRVDARVYGYFNQSVESRFYEAADRKSMNWATYSLPLLFVTEATWIADFVRALQPEAPVWLVRNGLSREYFPRVAQVPVRQGPVRVLVEGPWGVPFKGVPETFRILEAVAPRLGLEIGWLTGYASGVRPRVGGKEVAVHEGLPIDRVREVYRDYDVLLKLSRVEGMYGPPLEMFSQGGTAITSIVTGCDDLVVHGENGLLVPARDEVGVAGHLAALQGSPELLAWLRAGALATARGWPGWEEVSREFSGRLEGLGDFSNRQVRPALASLSALQREWMASTQETPSRLQRIKSRVRTVLGRARP